MVVEAMTTPGASGHGRSPQLQPSLDARVAEAGVRKITMHDTPRHT
jgi:hypothetical protein